MLLNTSFQYPQYLPTIVVMSRRSRDCLAVRRLVRFRWRIAWFCEIFLALSRQNDGWTLYKFVLSGNTSSRIIKNILSVVSFWKLAFSQCFAYKHLNTNFVKSHIKEVQYDSEHFLQTSNIYFTEKKTSMICYLNSNFWSPVSDQKFIRSPSLWQYCPEEWACHCCGWWEGCRWGWLGRSRGRREA